MQELVTGQKAPSFSLPDLEGNPAALEDFRGKIVLINFWSCECPWAERADRALRFKQAEWGARVAWISIAANANEEAAPIRAAAGQRGLPLVLVDAGQRSAEDYGALTTPHIFVVDEQGRLRYQGGLDDTTFRQRTATRMYAFEAVDALLRGEAPEVEQTEPYGCTIVRFQTESD